MATSSVSQPWPFKGHSLRVGEFQISFSWQRNFVENFSSLDGIFTKIVDQFNISIDLRLLCKIHEQLQIKCDILIS